MGRGQLPVEALAGAAVACRGRGRRAGGGRSCTGTAPAPRAASFARTAFMTFKPLRRAASAQYEGPSSPWNWRIVSGTLASVASTLVEGRVHEHAGDLDPAPVSGRDLRRGLEIARRGLSSKKFSPSAQAPLRDGELGVAGPGDSADLHLRGHSPNRRAPGAPTGKPPRAPNGARGFAMGSPWRVRRASWGRKVLSRRELRCLWTLLLLLLKAGRVGGPVAELDGHRALVLAAQHRDGHLVTGLLRVDDRRSPSPSTSPSCRRSS